MEYKKDDTVKLLRDYPTSNPSIVVKKNDIGRIKAVTEKVIFLEVVIGSNRIDLEVNINDIKFVERTIEETEECPICNSNDIDYGVCVPKGEQLFYPWKCNECGASGKEWYLVEFIETVCDEIK